MTEQHPLKYDMGDELESLKPCTKAFVEEVSKRVLLPVKAWMEINPGVTKAEEDLAWRDITTLLAVQSVCMELGVKPGELVWLVKQVS